MAVTQVDYERPIFWIPSKAINVKAASVRGERDGKPVFINFYWSGLMLAMRQEGSDEQLLGEEIAAFLKSHVPNGDEPVLHFRSYGEVFRKIADPRWVPAYRLV
jgi:hypothetical protein